MYILRYYHGMSKNVCDIYISVNSSPPSAIYMSVNWVSIVSSNGLPPVRRQAITWTNAVNCNLRDKLQWNSNHNTKLFIQENVFENVICEMVAILSRGRWVDISSYLNKEPQIFGEMSLKNCLLIWRLIITIYHIPCSVYSLFDTCLNQWLSARNM